MRKWFFVIVCFAISTTISIANDSLFTRYGLFVDYNFNRHYPNFIALPGCPSCNPGYLDGSGTGISFGGIFEYPINNNLLTYGRLELLNLNGLLTRNEETKVLIDTSLVNGEFTHTLDTKLSVISFEPGINYNIIKNLFLSAGINAGFFITNTYRQSEQITQPSDRGVFQDTKTRTRNDTSGTIQQISSVNLSLLFGLSYEFPLNSDETIFFAPEISYRYGLTNIVSTLDWKVNSFNLGIALKYSPKPFKQKIEPIYELKKEIKIDTVIVKLQRPAKLYSQGQEIQINSDTIRNIEIVTINNYFQRADTIFKKIIGEVKIQTYAQNEDGKIVKTTKIQINQQFVSQAFPLLPYIFFENKSSELQSKYNLSSASTNFNIEDLTINPIVFHNNILNIIGQRMKENPSATINLYGFTDPLTEGNDCNIANSRENSIKEYFTKVWGIAEERIKLISGRRNCLPINQTKTQSEEGYSENRRVEIESSNPSILAPIAKKRYLETPKINPPKLIFDPSGTTVENPDSWKLEVYQANGVKIFEETRNGNPVKISIEITEEQANNIINGNNIIVKLSVLKNNDTILGQDEISVQKDTSDFEVERLSLALFYVSGYELREVDKKAINQFTKDLQKSDSITVTGFTDYLGNPETNLILSEKRSEVVCNYIRDINEVERSGAIISSCSGVGSNRKPPQIHSFETPEERFLSRTVQLEIRRKWRVNK
ncbi:MAG: hypothetical protein EPN82_09700 [Bacteroidetes bacterium]|nr:MAG: hypothetical protein EPN82_09700 [Bacteroidota bacterium]